MLKITKKEKIAEKTLTAQLVRGLKAIPNIWFFKVFGGGDQRAGLPDFIGAVSGYAFGIEVKSTDGILSPLQIYEGREFLKAGGHFYGVHDEESLTFVLKCLSNLSNGLFPGNYWKTNLRLPKNLKSVKMKNISMRSL